MASIFIIGGTDWTLDNLRDAVLGEEDSDEWHVDYKGITRIKPDGYLESVRTYRVIER